MEMFDWEVKVQAFQNSVAIAMCNRTGVEGATVFSGRSLITDANGETIAQAGSGDELLYALARIRVERPYTSLRRPKLYR